MARAFAGIRIIDITHVLAGPFAAYQLALQGADVIKVAHLLGELGYGAADIAKFRAAKVI